MSATGTTATPGHATPASASTPSSEPASTSRPAHSWPGCSAPPASTVHGSLSCSPCTASTQDPNVCSPVGRAMPAALLSASGNAAAGQHQLDGYGWVLDAAWRMSEAGYPLYAETWRTMAGFADRVADRWREPDAGIWEVRSDTVHHVHSKLMAWLALDRALTHRRTPPDVGCAHQTVACRTGGAARGRRTAWLRRGKGHLHAQLRLVRHRRRPVDPAAAGVPPGRLRTHPRDHRRGHPRARGRIAAALPLPARTRRAARHRGRLPAVLVLARPGPRAQRTRDRSGRTVPRAPRRWPAPSGCTPRRWTPPPVSTWATTRRP